MLRKILRTDPESQDSRRSLAAALLADAGAARCRLIAEVKRRSPSAGPLRESLDPGELARRYVDAGAAAVSVLTERRRFGGSMADLESVAAAVDVPVLRKDFLTTESQLRDSASAGADAVLLIVRRLGPARVAELAACARAAGLEPLVEVHDPSELEAALASGADVIGVNNRDLETLVTDVGHSLAAARAAREAGSPWPRVAVSESGIRTRAEVLALADAGYRAVLVGETLLRARDPGAAAAELLGVRFPAGAPA
ncbi:MAG TPA: indole-3-glycerol-phosphate synthase [Gemmatimonadota bacterium]|jgi:indole-3-glycerol phosphate synthase